MNKSIQHFLLLSLVALSAASCVTQKKMTYLRDAGPEIADSINKKFDAQSETVIRSGDALTIVVSALDKEAVAPFNLYTVNQSSPGSAQIQTTSSLFGIRVGAAVTYGRHITILHQIQKVLEFLAVKVCLPFILINK